MVGINQIQVKPQIDLTFANALRSIVRQDPDVIMIGEIRDLETAQIAVQSALTGHLVLSTVHTNDARVDGQPAARHGRRRLPADVHGDRHPRAAPRAQAVPALQGAVRGAARDGRRSWGCGGSRRTHDVTLYHAKGCAQCSQTGYMGRFCILEMLPMTDPLRSLVMKHATSNELKAEAQREGHGVDVRGRHAQGARRADDVRGSPSRHARRLEGRGPRDARLSLPCRQSGGRGRRRRARRRQRGRDRRPPARPGPDADADRARVGRRRGGAAGRRASAAARRRYFEAKTVTRDQLLAVTRELATLLRAGLPLDRALEILIGLAPTPVVAALLQRCATTCAAARRCRRRSTRAATSSRAST